MEPQVQIALVRQLVAVVGLVALRGAMALMGMAVQDLEEITAVAVARLEILRRKVLAVRFVLSGQQIHVHSHRRIQRICNETLY
jgi:hypothetical protein